MRTVAGWNTARPTNETSAKAMKLSMIVLITSCAPKRALSTPGMNPQAPPAAAAASRQSGSSAIAGSPASAAPTSAAANPPR
ncbi:MAG: hypothetical protein A2V63_05345 [Candidatus Eisenbacteria bacterium RBG_19FT_COMBO_70_11]|nr:MAG: hypothetical protein A2V63_05345 [Candidatus Eisenbacteria bacterium RBG_19FT_COMBO_70_11]